MSDGDLVHTNVTEAIAKCRPISKYKKETV